MSLLIKICGVTRPDEAIGCAAAGADALGLNFYPSSPRFLPPAQAAGLAQALRGQAPKVLLVGVFVNAAADTIRAAFAAGWIDIAQLHGDEPPQAADEFAGCKLPLWKGLRVGGSVRLDGPGARGKAGGSDGPGEAGDLARLDLYRPPRWQRLVIDAPCSGYGGSGKRIDLLVAARAAQGRAVLLAGGLTPANVADAVRAVRPAGIDVASGVESAPGRKDLARVAALVAAARAAHDEVLAQREQRGQDAPQPF